MYRKYTVIISNWFTVNNHMKKFDLTESCTGISVFLERVLNREAVMSFLRDRVILLTGATGGLGKEMVKQFTKEGSKFILTDINEEALTNLKKENPRSKILFSFASDLSTKEGVNKVYETIKAQNIEVDFLINNAGLASIGSFITTPEDVWEKQYAVNLLAPVRLTKLFLTDMLKRESGHIVNIASVASYISSPGLSTYSSTKHGLRAFGEALYEELRSTRIRITNIYPFFTNTPMMQSPQYGMKEKKQIPFFLLSTPEEVISELIYGIKRDHLHVFPGLIAKTAEFMSRMVPQGMNTFFEYLR